MEVFPFKVVVEPAEPIVIRSALEAPMVKVPAPVTSSGPVALVRPARVLDPSTRRLSGPGSEVPPTCRPPSIKVLALVTVRGPAMVALPLTESICVIVASLPT